MEKKNYEDSKGIVRAKADQNKSNKDASIEFIGQKQKKSISEKESIIRDPNNQQKKLIRRHSICPVFSENSNEVISLCLHRHFEVQDSQKSTDDSSSEYQQGQQSQNHQENKFCSEYQESKLFQRLKMIIKTFQKFIPKVYKKLLSHLYKLSSADKYIKLLISLIKINQVFNKKSKLAPLSNQLGQLRRIIQWEGKYQIIKEFRTEQLSLFEVAFKTLQFSENIFDFGAFWLELFEEKYPSLKPTSDLLSSWSDDCYFYQTIISFCIYLFNTMMYGRQYYKLIVDDQAYIDNKQTLDKVEQNYNELANKFDEVKKLQDENKDKQTISQEFKNLEKLIKQKQKQYRQAGQNFHIAQRKMKDDLRNDLIRNGIKSVKFAFDVALSYADYSKSMIKLDPLTGGIFSLTSSMLSMYLIWAY